MKISQQPTNHILVKAHTDDECDFCDFAIIDCGGDWADRLKKRKNAAQSFSEDNGYFSSRFFDGSVSFYNSEDEFDIDEMIPTGRDWAFIELEDGEEEKFAVPENRLHNYMLILYKDGSGRFMAWGKHSGEDYYTEIIPLVKIANTILKSKNSDDHGKHQQ